MRKQRLVVVATHPIQNHVPYYRALTASPDLDLSVLYAALPTAQEQGIGFGISFEWDVPLLEGYHWNELEGVRRTENPLGSWSGLSGSALRRQLRDAGADCLLVTGWNSKVLVQAALAGRRLGVPVLVRGDSNDLRSRRLSTRLLHRVLLRLYSGFLFVGEANRRFYRSKGVAEDRLFFVPHCVDNDRFVACSRELEPRREELRDRYGLDDRFCFLFAGKLEEKKRVADLLRAAAEAAAGGARLQVLVVGTGPLEGDLSALGRERRLPVRFAGFHNQSQMPEAYAAADALVLPSDAGETWGLVVNEAMASGLPAVTSDRVGCTADLVREGETGYSYPYADVSHLADRLGRLARDPRAAHEMGSAARRLVSTRYSIRRATEGTVEAVKSLAARSS